MTDAAEPTFSTRELELQRRLGTVARQATVDAGAWDRLQDRIARDEPTSTATTRRLSRRVVAVAATVLLVLIIASLERREDKGRVDTVDDSTSTTVDRGRSSTTTTSTTPPVALPPGAQPADVDIGAAGSAGAAPDPSGDGDPASPGAGTSTPSGPRGPVTSPTTSPSPNAAPDGRVPAIVYPLLVNNRTVSVAATVWEDESSFHMNIWQTDSWRLYTTWTWGKVAGQNCFAGGTGTLQFGEFQLERFSWGLVRADAARVSVLTGDDYEGDSDERLGPEVLPGLRPWLARSTADATRFRAFDAGDWTLHYAGPPAWDARPDTC